MPASGTARPILKRNCSALLYAAEHSAQLIVYERLHDEITRATVAYASSYDGEMAKMTPERRPSSSWDLLKCVHVWMKFGQEFRSFAAAWDQAQIQMV